MAELVELGGIEYEETPCRSCNATGERYDPTLADNVYSQRHGMIDCPACHGERVTRKITKRGLAQERVRFEQRRAGR
jgi:hypothetical protein